ncbi:hypothetical protein CDAR_577181 [Caerostris darwini]|uniref:Uncharacterized protein n=1 Tax=Caerostris darwini TaxID=1538125 RepID=A0AAV4UGG1_9ARAC|nr:hypothetical protein CDAR_577181 [Caerostris darwini]
MPTRPYHQVMQQCHSNSLPPTQFSLAPVKDPLLQVGETGEKRGRKFLHSRLHQKVSFAQHPAPSLGITRLSKQAAHCIPKKDTTSFLDDNPSVPPTPSAFQSRKGKLRMDRGGI